jgi:Aspartyl protease
MKMRLLKQTIWIMIVPLILAGEVRAQGQSLAEKVPKHLIEQARKLNSMKQTGTLQMAGMSGSYEIYFKAPNKAYVAINLGIIESSEGYDGVKAWMRDQNGRVEEITGNEKKRIISNAYLTGQSYFLTDRMPGWSRRLKDTLISDRKYAIFLALPEGGDTIRLFQNVQTKRIEIVLEYIDEIPIYTYLSDFRTVDGIEIPFAGRTESSLPQLNSVMQFSEISVNIPLDDTIFQMPTTQPVDYLFPKSSDSVIIPMKYLKGHIFVEANVRGRKNIFFILDSGAGLNVIERSFAEELGLTLSGNISAKGVAGYESTAVAVLDTLTLGGVQLFDQRVAVIGLDDLSLETPGRLGGLLGYDLLSRFPFRIEYGREELILYNPERFVSPDSLYAVDLEFVMKAPVVTAEIDGHAGKFVVDFGNALEIILHKSWVDKYNLEAGFSDIKEMSGNIGGIGGSARAQAAVGNLFRLGPVEVKKPPLLIVAGDSGAFRSAELDGNIGNLMLQKFSILMDYSRKKLFILPSK